MEGSTGILTEQSMLTPDGPYLLMLQIRRESATSHSPLNSLLPSVALESSPSSQ